MEKSKLKYIYILVKKQYSSNSVWLVALSLTYCEIQPLTLIQVPQFLSSWVKENRTYGPNDALPGIAGESVKRSELALYSLNSNFLNTLSYNDIWWLFFFHRKFLQKYHAKSCLRVNLSMRIICWGSTFGENANVLARLNTFSVNK